MKIGFVLDDGLDKADGVQQYILSLGQYYSGIGHDIHYIVGETNRTDIANIHSMAKNLKVRFNGNALSIPLPASSRKIRAFVKRENFDVIHVQTPYSPFMGAKVVRNISSTTAVVGTFHILPFGWVSRVGTRLLGIWLRSSLRRFDDMVSVSQPAADFALQSFNLKTSVVPNSVPIARFKPTKPMRKGHASKPSLKLLFLGRLVHRKGCQNLLAAITVLKARNQLPANLCLDICGDGPLRPQLEKYAQQKGLSDIISFHGYVSERQKVGFMQKADICIFPSLSGESFGIVLIEAMAAAGGIVLGGNNPGYSSVLGEMPESLIEARDIEKFASQMAVFLTGPAARQKLFDLQQAQVKKFDTPLVGKRLLQIYDTCKKQRTNQ